MSSHEGLQPNFHIRDTHTVLHTSRRYESSSWDRLHEPSIILPTILLILTIIYSSGYQHVIAPPFVLQRLWNTLVFLTPAKLLFSLDNWLQPFPLPPHMLLARSPDHAAKSEVMARLLGLDRRGGIVASVSYAGATGLSKLLPKSNHRPAGLGNLSNSCYQNSILQGLTSLKPMREYLAWLAADGAGELPRLYAAEALAKLVAELHSVSMNGHTLWTPPVLKSMSTIQQQDAQEYFSKLLDEVEEEIAKALKTVQKKPGFESDAVTDETVASQYSDDSGYQSLSSSAKHAPERNASFRIPLEGLTGESVTCTVCGNTSGLKLQSFFCLTLNLGQEKGFYDIHELLNAYTESERLEDVQCTRCTLNKFESMIRKLLDGIKEASGEKDKALRDNCLQRLEAIESALEQDDLDDETLSQKCKISSKQRVKTTKTKQVGIARPPPSIALHINRSIYHAMTNTIIKNSTPVIFPRRLDLGPWCLGSAGSHAPGDEPAEEEWQLPSQLPMVAGAQQRSRLAGPFYELRAVVTHYGRHDNGHYVCYRKHPPAPAEEARAGEEGPANLEGDDVEGEDGEAIPLQTLAGLAEAVEEPAEEHWWRLSDQDVVRVDERNVLAQEGVFMLFYDRVDPNSVLVAEEEAETPRMHGGDGLSDLGMETDYTDCVESTGVIEVATTEVLPATRSSVPHVGGSIGRAADEVPTAASSIEVVSQGVKAAGRSPIVLGEPSVQVQAGAEVEVQAAARSEPTGFLGSDYDEVVLGRAVEVPLPDEDGEEWSASL